MRVDVSRYFMVKVRNDDTHDVTEIRLDVSDGITSDTAAAKALATLAEVGWNRASVLEVTEHLIIP
jgi:hypothetical protein